MDRIQFLFCKLAEEAAEVTHIAMKNQQFGMNETMPGQPFNNAERAHQEINDLLTIIDMLNEEFDFGFVKNGIQMKLKREKVEKFHEKSVMLGQVRHA